MYENVKPFLTVTKNVRKKILKFENFNCLKILQKLV